MISEVRNILVKQIKPNIQSRHSHIKTNIMVLNLHMVRVVKLPNDEKTSSQYAVMGTLEALMYLVITVVILGGLTDL